MRDDSQCCERVLTVMKAADRTGTTNQAPGQHTQDAQVLVLHLKEEPEGVTISCPGIDLAICGKTEEEARQRFLSAFADLKDFLEENAENLSRELKERLALLSRPTTFRFKREL